MRRAGRHPSLTVISSRGWGLIWGYKVAGRFLGTRGTVDPWRYGRTCVPSSWADLPWGPQTSRNLCPRKTLRESGQRRKQLGWRPAGVRAVPRNQPAEMMPSLRTQEFTALRWFVEEKPMSGELKIPGPTWSFPEDTTAREEVSEVGAVVPSPVVGIRAILTGPLCKRDSPIKLETHLSFQRLSWTSEKVHSFPYYEYRDGEVLVYVASLGTEDRLRKKWFLLHICFLFLFQQSWFHNDHSTTDDHRIV